MFHSRTSSAALMAIFMGAVCLLDLHAQGIGDWERLQIPARDILTIWPGEGVLAARKATGTFMLSYDDGETWSAPKDFSPWAVHFGENGKVVASSLEGLVMFSSDNGQSFTRTSDLLPFNSAAHLLGNGDHVLVGRRNSDGTYQYYRSEDGGATWSDFVPESSRVARAIAADGSYYSYEEQSKIYRYNDATNDWESVGDAPQDLHTLVAGSDNRLYGITTDGKLYRSQTNQASLAPYMPDLVISPYAGLPVSTSGDVYAVEKNSTGAKIIYKISDGGSNVVDIPVPLSVGMFSITTDEDGNLLTSAGHGDIERTYRYDGGSQSWEMLSVGGYGTISRIDLSENGDILALTKDGLYLSGDGGDTYDFTNVPEVDVQPIRDAVFLGSEGMLLSRMGANSRSLDNGVTWTQIEPGYGSKLFRGDNGVLYSYYSPRAYRSLDEGLTWETFRSVNSVITLVSGNGDYLFAVESMANMHYSSDGGTNWIDIPSIDGYPRVQTVAVLTDGTFIGGAGSIEKRTGEFFTYVLYQPGNTELMEYPLPCDRLNSEYLFAADANGKAYLASVCGLYRSDDGGRSWKWLAHLPSESTLTDLEITEDGDAYLGTEDGLFRLARVSSVDDRQADISGEVTLDVRPNPLRDAGLIRFQLSEAGHVRIGLYDQSGKRVRQIAEGQYSAGIHELDLGNLEGISSGSYLLVVRAGDRIAEEKVFILRDTR